ncbi:MAG: hypothetical protein E7B29_14255, partial [Mixta calida]|nr:hypothetical protein [Mixta calida]
TFHSRPAIRPFLLLLKQRFLMEGWQTAASIMIATLNGESSRLILLAFEGYISSASLFNNINTCHCFNYSSFYPTVQKYPWEKR